MNTTLYTPELAVFAVSIRQRRDELLAETDWLFSTTDRPEPSNAQAWRDYRQALRDVSQQPGFPTNIQWPSKPE